MSNVGTHIRQVVAVARGNITFVRFASANLPIQTKEKCDVCSEPAVDTRPSDGAYRFCSEPCRCVYYTRLSS